MAWGRGIYLEKKKEVFFFLELRRDFESWAWKEEPKSKACKWGEVLSMKLVEGDKGVSAFCFWESKLAGGRSLRKEIEEDDGGLW